MNWREALESSGAILDFRLFDIGGTPVTVATLITAVGILLAGFWISLILEGALRRAFTLRGVREEATIHLAMRLTRYLVMAVVAGVALGTAGVDLAALFATGAVFAVVIGFAMQNVAQNFVAGVILLVERTLKPGDVLEVEGTFVKVTQLGIRATVVRTLDDEDLIVPNSILVQSAVKNYTLKDSVYRVRANVGVIYGSDMNLVQKTLEEAASGVEWRLADHVPAVLMTGFGDNAVTFEVSVWISDPWRSRRRLSDLNQSIWWALKKEGIVIAFPQVDVHFDPPLMETMRSLARPAA